MKSPGCERRPMKWGLGLSRIDPALVTARALHARVEPGGEVQWRTGHPPSWRGPLRRGRLSKAKGLDARIPDVQSRSLRSARQMTDFEKAIARKNATYGGLGHRRLSGLLVDDDNYMLRIVVQ